MKFPMFIVDAFAISNERFTGNSAAVCLVDKKRAKKLWAGRDSLLVDSGVDVNCYLPIAKEMNLAETAFVSPAEDSTLSAGKLFNLRWFTPSYEVDLCGHATLATAHVLFNEIGNKHSEISFNTRSGQLICKRGADRGEIAMDFPQYELHQIFPLAANKWSPPPQSIMDLVEMVLNGLRLDRLILAPKSGYLLAVLANGTTRQDLENLPQHAGLPLPEAGNWRLFCIIVTVQETLESVKSFDFYSRFFCPWHTGIEAEDPATGSAHCALGPYWSHQLNKKKLKARQCYPGRGANFLLELEDSARITITGRALTVLRGELDL